MLETLKTLLNMGGYGWYIWPCYGLFFGLVGGYLWLAKRHQRTMIKKNYPPAGSQ